MNKRHTYFLLNMALTTASFATALLIIDSPLAWWRAILGTAAYMLTLTLAYMVGANQK